jgi:N-acetylglucosamine-6-phosphate deacetylase
LPVNGSLLLAGGRLVTADDDVDDSWLEIRDGRVAAVGRGTAPLRDGIPVVDVSELVVVPGLVDVHQHGGGGGSYDGRPTDVAEVVHFHRMHGTTTSMASLVSAPLDVLEAQLARLAPLVRQGLLAGLHLEGPWLSPHRAGAHAPAALRAPDPADITRLLAAGQGAVRMVTLAPELPGGLAAVAQLAEAGVVVALGHTDATYEQTREALRRGARAGTHLFNAMRPVHHREPGPVVALLESDAVVELIADGVHLHPAVLAASARVLGTERTLLVTDAMAGAGMPDGAYSLGNRDVTVAGGVARSADGTIAGSTATLADALRFAVTVAGIPLQAAVTAATSVPAALLRLDGVGFLRPGARADVTLLSADLRPAGVLFRGEWARSLPVGREEGRLGR